MSIRKPVDYGTMYCELTAILTQNFPQADTLSHSSADIMRKDPQKLRG